MIPGVTKERDPALIALERDIFSSLREISEEDDRAKNIAPVSQKITISALTPEEAIKELLNLYKQNKI